MNLTYLKGVFLLLISAAFSYYDVETDIRLALTYHKKGKCVKTLQSKSFRNLLDALLEPPRQFCKGSTYPYPLKLSTAWKSYHEQMWQQFMIILKNPYCEGLSLSGINTEGYRYVVYDDISGYLDVLNQTYQGVYCDPMDEFGGNMPFMKYPQETQDFFFTMLQIREVEGGVHWEPYFRYFYPLTGGIIVFGGFMQFLVILRLLCKQDYSLKPFPTPVRVLLLISSFVLMGPVVAAVFGAYYTLRHRENEELVK